MRRMRAWTCALWLVGGTAVLLAQPSAPPPGQPVFRTGVNLLTVDATIVDRDGRQVTDLTPAEFVVEVDGRPRPVISAEYVRTADPLRPAGQVPSRAAAPASEDAFFSTNTRAQAPGRHILLLVDEGNIRVGQGRLMMRSAAKFVDNLQPEDRVAMVAIPRGALVDFTADHEKVREALLATVGRASAFKGRFYMSLSEAIATVERSDALLRMQLLVRECAAVLGNPVEATRCEIEVENEAGEFVDHQRQQTQMSLNGIREVLRSLAVLDGPKSVILISEGLVLDGLGGDVDEIAAIAADVRASLDVMLLDVPDVEVAVRERPTTPREDRDRQVAGLESLAGLARGALHRIIASGDAAFVRVTRALVGHYLIAVEARADDRDGRRHRISVKTTRRGLTVYSRRGFLASTSAVAATPTEAVTRALRAPLTINDVPIRVATWISKPPGANKGRLLIVAEMERLDAQTLEYTAGLVIVSASGQAVVSPVEKMTLREREGAPGTAVFTGSVVVDPGSYRLRLAVADEAGRVGSVERKVDAWDMSAPTLTMGDLLLGVPGADGQLAPAIEPVVAGGRLAAVVEVYQPALPIDSVEATLEVVSDEQGEPLTMAPLDVGTGAAAEIGVAQGSVATSLLPPGRYLARATVRQHGAVQGRLVRPFRVAAASAATTAPVAVAALRLPPALIASMIASLPVVDRAELVAPDVLTPALTAIAQARPAAKGAIALAVREGLGPAALEALASGDQMTAALLRGLDFFAQGQQARAIPQLQLAMQQAPALAQVRLYLGAALALAQRHREAAGLLTSINAEVAGRAPVARMAAASWLHAGDAPNAIVALESANAQGDPGVARTLALAYLAANRPADAMPLLAGYLEVHPTDADTLFAGIYAAYATAIAAPAGDAAARARVEAWARTYRNARGPQQALVDAWLAHLREQK